MQIKFVVVVVVVVVVVAETCPACDPQFTCPACESRSCARYKNCQSNVGRQGAKTADWLTDMT